MTTPATKKDVEEAVEDLAGMTQRSFLHVQGQINGIQEQLQDIRTNMATKEDLSGMASKEDLSGMATKEDLSGMATKEDLSSMASKEDLSDMASKEDLSRMEDRIDAKLDKLIDRFDAVIDSHEQRITVLERQR